MPTRPPAASLPSTLQRSPVEARRTFTETLRHAEQRHGPGARASRIAWGAVKHAFEKVGDHWEPKARKGPSDEQSALSGAAARAGRGASAGGVDVLGHTRAELDARAAALGIRGRSAMNKTQLAQAIAKRQG